MIYHLSNRFKSFGQRPQTGFRGNEETCELGHQEGQRRENVFPQITENYSEYCKARKRSPGENQGWHIGTCATSSSRFRQMQRDDRSSESERKIAGRKIEKPRACSFDSSQAARITSKKSHCAKSATLQRPARGKKSLLSERARRDSHPQREIAPPERIRIQAQHLDGCERLHRQSRDLFRWRARLKIARASIVCLGEGDRSVARPSEYGSWLQPKKTFNNGTDTQGETCLNAVVWEKEKSERQKSLVQAWAESALADRGYDRTFEAGSPTGSVSIYGTEGGQNQCDPRRGRVESHEALQENVINDPKLSTTGAIENLQICG